MAKLKNNLQVEVDRRKLAEASDLVVEASDKFVDHFFEMDGEVFYSEISKLRDAVQTAAHSKRISNMKYVGPKWDFDKGITGEYYYSKDAEAHFEEKYT